MPSEAASLQCRWGTLAAGPQERERKGMAAPPLSVPCCLFFPLSPRCCVCGTAFAGSAAHQSAGEQKSAAEEAERLLLLPPPPTQCARELASVGRQGWVFRTLAAPPFFLLCCLLSLFRPLFCTLFLVPVGGGAVWSAGEQRQAAGRGALPRCCIPLVFVMGTEERRL